MCIFFGFTVAKMLLPPFDLIPSNLQPWEGHFEQTPDSPDTRVQAGLLSENWELRTELELILKYVTWEVTCLGWPAGWSDPCHLGRCPHNIPPLRLCAPVVLLLPSLFGILYRIIALSNQKWPLTCPAVSGQHHAWSCWLIGRKRHCGVGTSLP